MYKHGRNVKVLVLDISEAASCGLVCLWKETISEMSKVLRKIKGQLQAFIH